MQKALRYAASFGLLMLMLLCTAVAAAQQTVQLNEYGVRFTALEDERWLTKSDMQEDALLAFMLDEPTAASAMQNDNSVMMVLNADGDQVCLRVLDAPEAIAATDISQLDAQGREALLLTIGRMHDANTAAWLTDMPDYAICQSTSGETLTLHTLSLDTLYLGKIYSFRMEVIGRDPDEGDYAYIESVAERTLRLGQSATDNVELPLQQAPVLSNQTADVQVDDGGVLLTLDELPALSGSNVLQLSGKTDPEAKLRYQINGASSSAFSPNEDGTFSVSAPGLENGEENKVSVTATLEEQVTTCATVVTVDMQYTPLAISCSMDESSYSDTYTVYGTTLPGATVKFIRKDKESSVSVDEDGRFSFEIATRKEGNYGFTVRATYNGYRRTEAQGNVRRQSETSAKKAAKKLNYDKLAESPTDYEGTAVLYECTAIAFGYQNGTPMCLVDIGQERSMVLLLDSLTDIVQGDKLNALGTITGETVVVGDVFAPAMRVDALLP